MDIGTLMSKLGKLDVEVLCINALENNEGLLIELQQKQMTYGKNAKNEEIGYYRSPFYEEMKNRMNPLAQRRVDLKLTGAFHKGITVLAGKEIIFDSKDNKTLDLVEKYSEDIFGLNTETIGENNNEFQEILYKEFKKVL